MPCPHRYTDEEGGEAGDYDTTFMLLQPETKPITQEQLVNEVKGIYAGLVMVEKKCVEVCGDRAKSTKKLKDDQWQALIALHRTLLHEHHDFFLASQHPTASTALRRLASKYAMPARMWRHGIHAFLELLRHRLPESQDHMLSFIYIAYSMMALLLESVPGLTDTWIECLGDLTRYRMATEERLLHDREVWPGVSRMWCNKLADHSPDFGQIQRHLALQSSSNVFPQLFYNHTRALGTVSLPLKGREVIMALSNQLDFEPEEINWACYYHYVQFPPYLNQDGPHDAYCKYADVETLTERSADHGIDSRHFEHQVPWAKLASLLNSVGPPSVYEYDAKQDATACSRPRSGIGRQLPDNFSIGGLICSYFSYPRDSLARQVIDEDERAFDLPSHALPRAERPSWFSIGLVLFGSCMFQSRRRQSKQYLDTTLSRPRVSTNLPCEAHKADVTPPPSLTDKHLSPYSAVALFASLTTILAYLAGTSITGISRCLAESLFKVLESAIAWTTSSLPILALVILRRQPVYSILALLTVLPKATAFPVGGANAKSSIGLADFLPRMLEQVILWTPSSLLCLMVVLYCRDKLPFLSNPNAITNPGRTHGFMSFAWLMALLVVGGPDLAAQIHYPMRLAAVSELYQYGQAVFPELKLNFNFRPIALVLLGSLIFDSFMCFLMSPSQGIDVEVFMKLLQLSVWLTLTLASGRSHVVDWTRGGVHRLGESAVALAGVAQD